MGWASGSVLFSEIITSLQPEIQDARARVRVYKLLIAAFEDKDWDTQDECLGEDPAYDTALKEMHPEWDLL